MIVNKKKRLKYLGFDDFWFAVIGILILSFVTDYLFNNSFVRYNIAKAMVNWGVSLFFTIFHWSALRAIIILIRKRYPEIKHSFTRIVLFFVSILVSVTAIDSIGNIFLSYIFNQDYNPVPKSRLIMPIILISMMTVAIYEAVYFYIKLKKSIREEEQAKSAIVQAQLNTLRNQARPHFLFNSLNTLRDIIDQNSKDDAKKFVDKLSGVYRFILDSGNANLISLRKELEFAKSYIHIQSERFGDNLILNWNIAENVLDKMIAPMSIQLLLENAIKHNVVAKSKPLTICVEVKDNYLVVTNKIQHKSTQIPSTKLGLKNIEKRYALISNIPIQIKNDGNQFKVAIPLLTPSDQKQVHANTNH